MDSGRQHVLNLTRRLHLAGQQRALLGDLALVAEEQRQQPASKQAVTTALVSRNLRSQDARKSGSPSRGSAVICTAFQTC